MRCRVPLSILTCAVAAATAGGCSQEPAGDAVQPPPPAQPVATRHGPSDAPAKDAATRLTIYSGDYPTLADGASARAGMPGYALVSRPLHYTLDAGLNTISAINVPRSIDVEGAVLQVESPDVSIDSQRYVDGLSGTADVISQLIGERITVEHTAGGAKQTDSGILLAADNGLTLALDDQRVKVIREYDSFSVIDGATMLPQAALLRWTVDAQSAGDASFQLGYPMGGLAWRAEYRATLANNAAGGRTGCQLALEGAALVVNRSDSAFAAADVTLVAGEPNLVQGGGGRRKMAYALPPPPPPPPPSADTLPTQRRSGEYHAYELPGTTRIGRGAIERVALFAAQPTVACERRYVVDAHSSRRPPRRPLVAPGRRGPTGKRPVVATVSLHNTDKAGLGLPLPAGRVRVFEAGANGDDLLGESRLSHTPVGAQIDLQLGEAFDLGAKREATAFELDRSGRTLTESFAVSLANAKPTDVVVRVIESLPRWSDWQILASSVPVAEQGAHRVEFDVPVPARGETRLTYTVRYRWAEGIKP